MSLLKFTNLRYFQTLSRTRFLGAQSFLNSQHQIQNYTTNGDTKPDSTRGIKKPNVYLKKKVEPPPQIYYKTPTNRGKVFQPTTINVGKGIKHLKVNVFDETDNNLGEMNLAAAEELSKEKELKLVIIDEESSPVKFKLMTGSGLYAMQQQFREANKEVVKVAKQKEVVFKLGIEENDFAIKIKMIQGFFEKGNSVRILVKSVINKKWEKNIAKLQDEFMEKLKHHITFAKVVLIKKNDHNIVMTVEAKPAEDIKS